MILNSSQFFCLFYLPISLCWAIVKQYSFSGRLWSILEYQKMVVHDSKTHQKIIFHLFIISYLSAVFISFIFHPIFSYLSSVLFKKIIFHLKDRFRANVVIYYSISPDVNWIKIWFVHGNSNSTFLLSLNKLRTKLNFKKIQKRSCLMFF